MEVFCEIPSSARVVALGVYEETVIAICDDGSCWTIDEAGIPSLVEFDA